MMPKDLTMEIDDLIADVIEYLLADEMPGDETSEAEDTPLDCRLVGNGIPDSDVTATI